MKFISFLAIVLSLLITLKSCKAHIGNQDSNSSNKDSYSVAVYYSPDYHQDPRTVRLNGYGWTGWELVKNSSQYYEGDQQFRIPLWGYTECSNPRHMEQKIDAAADHGVDIFIFDWYYYNNEPFLQGALEEGFLKASNRNRLKFALMWSNHDWVDVFLKKDESAKPEYGPKVLYKGTINEQIWDEMTNYIIENYFKHSAYWAIDNVPFFSVYDLSNFLQSFGTLDKAEKSIEKFRDKARKAGFRDIHMNVVGRGNIILPSGKKLAGQEWMELIVKLGFTSTTSYSWAHAVEPNIAFQSYNDLKEEYFAYAEHSVNNNSLCYFPNVSIGLDRIPGARQEEEYVVNDNTPEKFKLALEDMKRFLDTHPSCNHTLIINSWNEWTEGSYLEPDTVNKMAYLEALGLVFQ